MNPTDYKFKNEIVINKCVQILDKTCYVLSISEDHDRQYFWVMYKQIRYENVSEIQPMTHRERNEMHVIASQIHPSLSFKSIQIQGQKSTINAAQYFYTPKKINPTSAIFNHFQTSSFNILDKNTDYYIIRMTIDSPVAVDLSIPLALSLKKSDDNIEHLINQEVTFDHVNEQFIDIKHPTTHQVLTYCFSPMLHYDIWSDLDKKGTPGYSQEQFRNDCLSLCPEDEVMQTILYKSKEDLPLSIYTKEKLASPLERNHRSPGLSILLGYDFADNKDLHTFSCNVGHVKPGSKEPVIVEIFSIHIKKEGLWYKVE